MFKISRVIYNNGETETINAPIQRLTYGGLLDGGKVSLENAKRQIKKYLIWGEYKDIIKILICEDNSNYEEEITIRERTKEDDKVFKDYIISVFNDIDSKIEHLNGVKSLKDLFNKEEQKRAYLGALYGVNDLKEYQLINNCGYTFTLGGFKYDLRHYLNSYGVDMDYWELTKGAKVER